MTARPDDDAALGPFVRPFVVTGGRTRPPVAIKLDALVLVRDGNDATTAAPTGRLDPEHQRVIALCATPQSVADVAADLGTAIGVATVLIGDLIAGGQLALHHATASRTDVDLLERLAAGVRGL